MRRLTQREQSIFILCLIMVFLYAGYAFLLSPFKEKSATIDQDIVTKQKKLFDDLKTIRKSKAVAGEYSGYFNKFKQLKPNEEVMSSMVSEIESVANDLKLHISDLQPKRVKKTDYFNQFSVSLTIDSSFVDIIHFLHILQNEPHLFDVEEVNFEKGPQRKAENVRTSLILTKVAIP